MIDGHPPTGRVEKPGKTLRGPVKLGVYPGTTWLQPPKFHSGPTCIMVYFSLEPSATLDFPVKSQTWSARS